jgi:putative pyruvate formate lyase activating enzyme
MKEQPATAPGYLTLLDQGELEAVATRALRRLENCDVCPWTCRVNRLVGEVGVCQTGARPLLASYGPHMGEERVLSGQRGSGTIFFSRCNMKCQYCQNADISQHGTGTPVDAEELANIMLELQQIGCHNINFVSPSHVVPQIVAAVLIAARAGLRLPLVYNSGGYDSVIMLKTVTGIFDIYMPDMKYGDPTIGSRYSKVPNYPQINQAAVREMHRQVGDLVVDESGVAVRGLLVRHLVLPNELAGTTEVVEFLAHQISKDTYLNIMDQYRPHYHAAKYPELGRTISLDEWRQAVEAALAAGLHRLDHL